MNSVKFTAAAMVCAAVIAIGFVSTCVAQEQPATSGLGDNTITLRSENVELTTVLRLFAELGGVNIIAGQDVSGTVSVSLSDVPFDEALSAILGVAGYTCYTVGSIIYVTTEARKAELPSGASDLTVRSFRIDYTSPEEMLTTVLEMLSPSGKAWLNATDLIVVRDAPAYVSLIEMLVNEVDVMPDQVRISAKIINLDREDNMNIGIGFDTAPINIGGLEAVSSGFAAPLALGSGTGLFLGTLQNDFSIFLEALNERGHVEILASPEILVVDGETARIQIGERLGFRVTTTTETASLESIEFLEVGTVLEVTPLISADHIIQMEISPKVSTGFIGTTGLPSEQTTELTTTMMVKDGETIIIGGLLNASRQRTRSQIPFLGDIPVIGRLFGRRSWTDDENEVVVMLTPQILGPYASPKMNVRIDAAEERWGDLIDKRAIHDGVAFPNESPALKWGRIMRGEKNNTVESGLAGGL